jgi:hypothetical protein
MPIDNSRNTNSLQPSLPVPVFYLPKIRHFADRIVIISDTILEPG